LKSPREYPQFKFDDRLHDPDPKIVLGKKDSCGRKSRTARKSIALLTKNPSTARFISTKPCAPLRFRYAAARAGGSHGQNFSEIRRRQSGEVPSRNDLFAGNSGRATRVRAQGQDAVRACGQLCTRPLGTDVDTPMPLVGWVGRIGEPLYQCQPPTGYSDKMETWVNTGSLLNRLKFFAGPRWQIKCAARAATSARATRHRFFERSEGRARPRRACFSWRPSGAHYCGHNCKSNSRIRR